MNSKKVSPTPTRIFLSAVFLILIVISVSVGLWQYNASASELGTLDDASLHKKALALAHKLGLEGEPRAEKMVRMNLAQAEKPLGSKLGKDAGQFGLTANMPVFVYVVRGKVEPTSIVEYPPNKPPPTYDRILLILNARNGRLITRGYIYTNAELPTEFQIP